MDLKFPITELKKTEVQTQPLLITQHKFFHIIFSLLIIKKQTLKCEFKLSSENAGSKKDNGHIGEDYK